MTWEKIRCFECGTVFEKPFCEAFAREYGRMEYCPICGNDYLLGFTDANDSITVVDR